MTFFKSVKKTSRMSDAIVKQIEKNILLGKMKAGFMLPSEIELTKQFGVSRNTTREALRMLEASGIIKIRQGSKGGAVVNKVTNEFISDFLSKAILLGGFSGDSIAEFRVALEPQMAAMLATADIDPDLVSQMENNVRETVELRKADKVTGYKNLDFHFLLALATGNPMFIIILNTLRLSLDVISPILKTRHQTQIDSIEYHRKILKAIKAKDPVEAREQMHKHLVELRDVVKDKDFKGRRHDEM
jgi:GntR family transcriptional regulator, transcriptional repressor for pyruvate dehydrogenase complex